MIEEAYLYGLGLISHVQYVALAKDYHCTERKISATEANSFDIRVSFRLASMFCMTNNISSALRIKKVFKQYDCEDRYRVFISLKRKYPRLMRRLRHRGVIPRSTTVVHDEFMKLYNEHRTYIAKYVRRKLGVLKKNFRTWQDIELDFIAIIWPAYCKVFLHDDKAYIKNHFKMSIRNAGKLLLQKFSRIKRGEINNSLTGQQTKVHECGISDGLTAILKADEVDDDSELVQYIATGTTIGARLCRILAGSPEPDYLKWLKRHKVKKSAMCGKEVYYVRKYFKINDATWERFKRELTESYL